MVTTRAVATSSRDDDAYRAWDAQLVISVVCKQTGRLPRNARVVVALSRGKRMVGWGSGAAKRTIRLHHRRHLRGRYSSP